MAGSPTSLTLVFPGRFYTTPMLRKVKYAAIVFTKKALQRGESSSYKRINNRE
jgi:hypothetical protein